MDFNLALFIFTIGMFAGAFLASKDFRGKVMGYLNKDKQKAPDKKPGAKPESDDADNLEPISRTRQDIIHYRPKSKD